MKPKKTKSTPSPWLHFGSRLKAILIFNHTPISLVATHCSCCESLISRWFAGDRYPSIPQLLRLSSLLSLSPRQLLGSQPAALKATLKLPKHKLPPLENLPKSLGQPELPTTVQTS